ncbi:MAG: 30S ribosomal protein S6 [Deltaproteobacteria bacterium]|nr:30S ribosomal protein S6 [Deltaproteobacteria bacterium]MBI4374299.1 30S ribosomal protein S6 [Deltaproteobacteria bacterium]
MENYETVYILRPDLTEEAAKKINDKILEVISRRGGGLTDRKDLGKKMLAYKISHQNRGHYFQLNFQGSGPVVEDLEKNLRFTEEVLRFLTVRPESLAEGGV